MSWHSLRAAWRESPPAVRRAALVAWPLLWLARLALRINVARCLAWQPALGSNRPATAPAGLALAVQRAGRALLPAASCLERALVLRYLLARQGGAATLRIGVRLSEAGLLAHAWVELAGEALGESAEALAAYQPFESPCLPARFE